LPLPRLKKKKERKQAKVMKRQDFNQTDHLGKMEIKHVSPSSEN
jgi:hypothetical protein